LAERTPPAVRDAAERLVTDLAGDERFAAHVAKSEIDRLVAAGELIPIGRLQLGGGLELTPMGRVATLEGAVASALALLDADLPNKVDALRAVLGRVGAATSAPPGPMPQSPVTGPPEPAEVVDNDAPVVVADDDRADGRPEGMLKEGETSVCDWCKEPIDHEQANLAYVRFRTHLCKAHYAKHPKRSAA
jgi:hypothetical protein